MNLLFSLLILTTFYFYISILDLLNFAYFFYFSIAGPTSYTLSARPGLRPGEADLRLEVGRHQLRQGDQGEEVQAATLHGRAHLPGELPGLRGRELY